MQIGTTGGQSGCTLSPWGWSADINRACHDDDAHMSEPLSRLWFATNDHGLSTLTHRLGGQPKKARLINGVVTWTSLPARTRLATIAGVTHAHTWPHRRAVERLPWHRRRCKHAPDAAVCEAIEARANKPGSPRRGRAPPWLPRTCCSEPRAHPPQTCSFVPAGGRHGIREKPRPTHSVGSPKQLHQHHHHRPQTTSPAKPDSINLLALMGDGGSQIRLGDRACMSSISCSSA